MSSKDAPPSYETAASSSGRHSEKHESGSGIPAVARRSMEDISRPLPKGWIRQMDPKSQHHFYVDTKAKPPRSLWSHPLDDEQYRSENPEEAKELSLRQPMNSSTNDHPDAFNPDDYSSDEGDNTTNQQSSSKPAPTGIKKLGQSMKNKMSGSTHEERVAKRQRQKEREQKAYQEHQAIRAAMSRATQTGQPQLVGKDQQGRELYAQPPPVEAPYVGSNLGYTPYQQPGPYGYGGGGYGGGGYGGGGYGGYSAPYGPYNRRQGYGYGGGMGMPLMGGMMGGMMLGGLLF